MVFFTDRAIEFNNLLLDYYGYKEENIYLLLTTDTFSGESYNDIKDRECNLENIEWAINEIASKSRKFDEVIIWYFAHGNIDIIVCGEGGTNLLTASHFDSLLDKITSNEMYVFIEACNSGSFLDDLEEYNRLIFTSCKEDEESYGYLVSAINEGLTYTTYGYPYYYSESHDYLFGYEHFNDGDKYFQADLKREGNRDGHVSMYELWQFANDEAIDFMNENNQNTHPQIWVGNKFFIDYNPYDSIKYWYINDGYVNI